MKTRITLTILAASLVVLLLPAFAGATPRPDPTPQSHGGPVVILPSCSPVVLPRAKHVWVEESEHGVVVCAGFQGGNARMVLRVHRLWSIAAAH